MQATFQCLGLQRGVNLVSKVLYLPVPWRGPGNKVGWGGWGHGGKGGKDLCSDRPNGA